MRTSQKRTTTAVLRAVLGMKVDEFAELLGCSAHAVNSLESGRLALGEALAEKIFIETGISPRWLLAGDVSAPPKSARWDPFTRETFIDAQAMKATVDARKPHHFAIDFANAAAQLHDLLSGANRTGRYRMAHYKIEKFLNELADEYGWGASGQAAWASSRAAMEAEFALADATFAKIDAHFAETNGAPTPTPVPAHPPTPPAKSPSRSRKVKAKE